MAFILVTAALVIIDFGVRVARLAITGWRLRRSNVLFVDQAGWGGKRILTVRLYVRDFRVLDRRLLVGPFHIVRGGRRLSALDLGESLTWPEGSIFHVPYRELENLLAPKTVVPWVDVPDVPVLRIDLGMVRRLPQIQTLRVLDLIPVGGVEITPVAFESGGYRAIDMLSPNVSRGGAPGLYAVGSRAFANYGGSGGFYAVTILPVLYSPLRREARISGRVTLVISYEKP